MKNEYLETEREGLKNKIAYIKRRINEAKASMYALEQELEFKSFILSGIERELEERGVNLEELDEVNKW